MLEAICATCKSNTGYIPSEWFAHIQWLYRLQQAGYPFKKNDLDTEEWLGLAEMREALEEIRAGIK